MGKNNVKIGISALLSLLLMASSQAGGLAGAVYAEDGVSAAADQAVSETAVPGAAKEKPDEGTVGNGNLLYQVLKVTGSGMPEEQIFSAEELIRVRDAEALELSVETAWEQNGTTRMEKGISLERFLELCGADLKGENASVGFCTHFPYTGDTSVMTGLPLNVLKGAVLLLPNEEEPWFRAVFPSGEMNRQEGIDKILINAGDTDDPGYSFHDRELQYMKSIEFTVNFIDKGEYSTGDDQAVPFRTQRFTLGEIEALMKENPEMISGNYFGISANEESKKKMGLGGFFDYYEGLNLNWFLRTVCGLQEGDGAAVLYGRDNDRFAEIPSLEYFFTERKGYSDYYLELTDTLSVNHVVPVLAVSKNGCPLLPRHDHEMEGNHDYSVFNKNAEKAGFSSKIGLQKNVSGPMIAALANLDGVYGGYRNETAGDCVRMDFYVDRALYNPQKSYAEKYGDVPAGAWFEEYVSDLTGRGVVRGMTDTAFCPDDYLTRAQFVKMLACASGDVTGLDPAMPFTDVDAEGWAWPFVKWGLDHSLVQGISEDRFSPDAFISRQDMAVLIDRWMKYKGIQDKDSHEAAAFTDAGNISAYAADAVASLNGRALQGYPDGTFRPRNNATRAEACKVISACMEQLYGRK